jgi:hypothetical protein
VADGAAYRDGGAAKGLARADAGWRGGAVTVTATGMPGQPVTVTPAVATAAVLAPCLPNTRCWLT